VEKHNRVRNDQNIAVLFSPHYEPKSIDVYEAAQLISSCYVTDTLLDALMLDAAISAFEPVWLITARLMAHWQDIVDKSTRVKAIQGLQISDHKERNIWILPFHDAGRSHWYLMVFDQKEKLAYIMDPLPKNSYSADIKKLESITAVFVSFKFSYVRINVGEQQNLFDCGPLVYKMAKAMLKTKAAFRIVTSRVIESDTPVIVAKHKNLRSNAMKNLLSHDPSEFDKVSP
jgi:Ulp1 protease family, C-terminal catalytic domain